MHDIVTAEEVRTTARAAVAEELADLIALESVVVIDGGAPDTVFSE